MSIRPPSGQQPRQLRHRCALGDRALAAANGRNDVATYVEAGRSILQNNRTTARRPLRRAEQAHLNIRRHADRHSRRRTTIHLGERHPRRKKGVADDGTDRRSGGDGDTGRVNELAQHFQSCGNRQQQRGRTGRPRQMADPGQRPTGAARVRHRTRSHRVRSLKAVPAPSRRCQRSPVGRGRGHRRPLRAPADVRAPQPREP